MRSFSRFSASRPEVVQSCAGAFTWCELLAKCSREADSASCAPVHKRVPRSTCAPFLRRSVQRYTILHDQNDHEHMQDARKRCDAERTAGPGAALLRFPFGHFGLISQRALAYNTLTLASHAASFQIVCGLEGVARGGGTSVLSIVHRRYASAPSPVQEELDLREMVAYGAYGSVVSNVGHLWYRHLHVITNRTFRLGTYPMIGAKLCADCFIFNPIHVSALISWTHLATMKPAEVWLFRACFLSRSTSGSFACASDPLIADFASGSAVEGFALLICVCY